MVKDPLAWIEPFVAAGADGIMFCFDSAKDPGEVLAAIKSAGKMTGVSLLITESLEVLKPYWNLLDLVTLVGTAMGIKGASMDEGVPDKIRQARRFITENKLKTEIEVDGGIRRESVPLIQKAGADFIVPGSLMFKEDPEAIRKWLRKLE